MLKVIGWRLFKVSLVLLVIALLAFVVFAVVVLWLMGTNHIDDGRAASLIGAFR